MKPEKQVNGNGQHAPAVPAQASAPAVEGQEYFKVPAQTFAEIVQILGQLPFGQVLNVMQKLMALRPER